MVAESASATIAAPFSEALTFTPETNGQAPSAEADGSSSAAVWLPDESDTKLVPWMKLVVSEAVELGRYRLMERAESGFTSRRTGSESTGAPAVTLTERCPLNVSTRLD